MDNQLSRRELIRDAAVGTTVLAAGLGVAACGTSTPSGSGSPSTGSGSTTTAGAPTTTDPAAATTTASGGGTANALASTLDIPVGGGKIFADKKVVVTQPVAGTFKGFSSTCTHLGCTVNKVADGLIQCPCHGSRYSVVDGTVKAGPAPKPLPPQNITVSGTQINLA